MAFKAIDEDAMKLKNKIVNFTLKLEEMKVTQLSGLDAVFTYKAIKDLLASIAELSKFYGIDQLDDGDTKHGK